MTNTSMFDTSAFASIDNEFGLTEEVVETAVDDIDNEFGLTEPEPLPVISSGENLVAAANFEAAFASEYYKISYDEVKPLVTTNLINHLHHNQESEDNTSVAEALLKIFSKELKPFEAKEGWSEKKIAKRRAKHEEKQKAQTDFISRWKDLLGYVKGYCEISENFNLCSQIIDNPLLASVQYCAGYDLEPGTRTKFGRKDNRRILQASRSLPVVDNFGELVLALMVKATERLTSEQKVDLLCELDSLSNFQTLVKTKNGTGILVENFMFDLGDASVTRVTSSETGVMSYGRKQTAIKLVMFNDDFAVDGVTAIFVWMLNSMRMNSKALAQAVNMSSNFFVMEINYGMKARPDNMSWHVYHNMVKKAKIDCANMSFFPYSNLSNSKLPVNALKWVLDRGVHAMCDKQNKSWVAINSGAEAMFVGRSEEGYLINLNDMGKPTKLFNRPAANVYMCAEIL